ncbi:hypothetical protein DL771_010556 [Monosporascus sp. 5C6A]|nr:hypothetical protein DL771_010556 [Monosporascus sp. 5C6A]
MAEVFGAVSLLTSLLAFTSSSLVVAQQITRGDATAQSLVEELEVVEVILTECIDTLRAHSTAPDIPASITRCLMLCAKKRDDAINIMQKIHGNTPGQKRSIGGNIRYLFLAVQYEQPLIARFNSFRDTVLLLRDLTADLRIEGRMLQLSSTMTMLLNEENQFDRDAESIVSEENQRLPRDGSPHRDGTGRPPRPRRRLDANKFLFEFISLQKFDFKRDIFVLVELAGFTGADMYEHVPLRNIVDLGSNEDNFIARRVLDEHNMDPAKISELPEGERTKRTLKTIGGSFTPTQEVTLYWHRLKDASQRRARFIVVDDEAFDVIIGHRLWESTEGPVRHGYLAMPGYQSRKEKKKTDKAREEKRREAWATIQRQREDAATGTSKAASTTGGTSTDS